MKIRSVRKCLGVLGGSLLASLVCVNAEQEAGAVYTMDNEAGNNHVLAWSRAQNGSLSGPFSYATGGAGTGSGLSSQGAVLLSHDARWLLVCNAGSDEISVFSVSRHGLELTDKASSGGRSPVSLTLNEDLLYVLNAGGGAGDKDNITAFRLLDGKLSAVPQSTRVLSGDNTGPAQVAFTKDGDVLVVTERTTSLIDTFTVDDEGSAMDHKVFQSAGVTPFGFAVGRHDQLFVSEAGGGSAPSSASSYIVSKDGDLQDVSAAVPTKQAAACWLIASHDGRFVYTANAGSGSLSGFSVDHSGGLELLNANGITAVDGTGSHPVDMTLSRDGRFLYSLANGNGTIEVFRTSHDGSLEALGGVTGLPTSAAGLAGR
jgi:6-phosphogluconolactonase (cycloisomerase 2 family)